MKKQWINRTVDKGFSLNGTLKEVIAELKELEAKGATHLDVEVEEEWGSYYVTTTAREYRQENDDEYRARRAQERKDQRAKRALDEKREAKRKEKLLETYHKIKEELGL